MSIEKTCSRIDNINTAERVNKSFLRRIRIRDYLPGQVTYGLGDYPAMVDAMPTEYDYTLLKEMSENGVGLVQVHEEWNDAVRLYGADKFNAPNKEGMKKFVELCHYFGMKVICYVSSGYFHEGDPDFREEFTKEYFNTNSGRYERRKLYCTSNYYKYRKCSHGSAEWREYILPRTFGVLDEYGFDGIFNDWGYDGTAFVPNDVPLPYDPELEDMLGIIYSEVKRRGGIYKLHADRNNKPPCKDKVYDYLWIGEGVESSAPGVGKDYPPYVVPCIDLRRNMNESDDGYFARTIPYLQFPLLKYGRPVLGNNQNLPGVTYYGGGEQEFYKKVAEYMKNHSNGPYIYSLWSEIPDDPKEYPNWLKYLKLYLPMVTENSLSYIELSKCLFVKSPIIENVCVSMFVNESIYLVVSNFNNEPYELLLDSNWIDRVTGEKSNRYCVKKNKILFLLKE